jgi:hypothetical protein
MAHLERMPGSLEEDQTVLALAKSKSMQQKGGESGEEEDDVVTDLEKGVLSLPAQNALGLRVIQRTILLANVELAEELWKSLLQTSTSSF